MDAILTQIADWLKGLLIRSTDTTGRRYISARPCSDRNSERDPSGVQSDCGGRKERSGRVRNNPADTYSVIEEVRDGQRTSRYQEKNRETETEDF